MTEIRIINNRTELDKQIAERAVACNDWETMAGIFMWPGYRYVKESLDGWHIYEYMRKGKKPFAHWADLPDLSDPATRGCLLKMVRDSWGEQTLSVIYDPMISKWCIHLPGRKVNMQGLSEAEALVIALERGCP
jgi:hypothetical protein